MKDVPSRSDKESVARKGFRKILKTRKGEGYAARITQQLTPSQLPDTLVRIMGWLHWELAAAPLLRPDDDLFEIFEATCPELVCEPEE
jgi:hypothetical protein